jgi:hypothetical protein
MEFGLFNTTELAGSNTAVAAATFSLNQFEAEIYTLITFGVLVLVLLLMHTLAYIEERALVATCFTKLHFVRKSWRTIHIKR